MAARIDATALGSGRGGDETMLRGLLAGLVATADEGEPVEVLAPDEAALPAVARRHPAVRLVPTRPLPGALHHGLRLPAALVVGRGGRPDVVLTVTHGPLASPVPVALMVQDLSFEHHPELYPPAARARLRALVPHQARRAAAVLTVSDHARHDLLVTYGLDPARVHHVPNVVAEPPLVDPADAVATRRALSARGVRGPYVLYLGNLHPRKNVPSAIRAFTAARAADPALADHRLVVAGARWWGAGEEAAAAEAPAGTVISLGPVSELEKEVLLGDARALVYVSLFEGFGLPPLEAMARGLPVVASRATSLPEVCGDAAVLVDPHDVDAIAAGLGRLLVDDDLRSRCTSRGRARAAAYSPTRTGRALRHALAQAAGRPLDRSRPQEATP